MRPRGAGEGAEHGFGIGQRDAADEMHDRLFASVCGHDALPAGCEASSPAAPGDGRPGRTRTCDNTVMSGVF